MQYLLLKMIENWKKKKLDNGEKKEVIFKDVLTRSAKVYH